MKRKMNPNLILFFDKFPNPFPDFPEWIDDSEEFDEE